jgi:hypothetical protein
MMNSSLRVQAESRIRNYGHGNTLTTLRGRLLLTAYLVIAVMTIASAALRVVERWVRFHCRVELARAGERTLMDALLPMGAGYGLEHHGPDGSQWLVNLSSPDQLEPGGVAR